MAGTLEKVAIAGISVATGLVTGYMIGVAPMAPADAKGVVDQAKLTLTTKAGVTGDLTSNFVKMFGATSIWFCMRNSDLEAVMAVTAYVASDGKPWWYIEVAKMSSGTLEITHLDKSFTISESTFEVASPGYVEYTLPR